MTNKKADDSGGLDIIDKLVRPEKSGEEKKPELKAKKKEPVASVVEKPVKKAAPVFGKSKKEESKKDAAKPQEAPPKAPEKSKAELEQEEQARIQVEIQQKVIEMVAINKQLALETDLLSKDNGKLFDQAKRNKATYEAVLAKLKEKEEGLSGLRHEITDSRIACNHLLNDVVFLRDKNIELNQWVDEKSQALGKLLSRVSAVKRNYEFISGESNFSEDILASLDTLLGKTFDDKKSINDRLTEAKDQMDTLYDELQGTLRMGKEAFYRDMVKSASKSE